MAGIVIKVGKRGKTRIPEETLKEMHIDKNDFVLIEIKHKATWREMLTPEALEEVEKPPTQTGEWLKMGDRISFCENCGKEIYFPVGVRFCSKRCVDEFNFNPPKSLDEKRARLRYD